MRTHGPFMLLQTHALIKLRFDMKEGGGFESDMPFSVSWNREEEVVIMHLPFGCSRQVS